MADHFKQEPNARHLADWPGGLLGPRTIPGISSSYPVLFASPMSGPVDEDDKVEFIHRRIRTALDEGLDERWEEVLLEWESASPSRREMVKTHVSGIRNRVWNSLSEIRSVDGLQKGLAIQYVELKARWTMLNTQIQSQTVQGGRADDELVYRATCISLIIQALEPLLRREQVDALTDRLNETVQSGDA